MTIKREEVRDFFISLKKMHLVYQIATEEQRGKLLNLLQPTFLKGEELGIDKVFSETLVTSGKDFCDSLFGEGDVVASDMDAEVIFS